MRTDEEILAAYEASEGNFAQGAKLLGMKRQGFSLRCHRLRLSPTGKRQETPIATEPAASAPVAPSTPEQCECGAWRPSFASVCHRCGKNGPGAHLLVALKDLGQSRDGMTEANRRVTNMIDYWSRKAQSCRG